MEQLTIGIIDDNPEDSGKLYSLLKSCEQLHNIQAPIIVYPKISELLNYTETIKIIFLASDTDAISVGRKLKESNLYNIIIFASNDLNVIKDAIKIPIFRLISKPYTPEEIETVLTDALTIFPQCQTIQAYLNRNVYNITQIHIEYIRAYNGYVEIVTDSNIFRKDISLIKLEPELNSYIFFRISRQIIINLLYVRRIDDSVELISGINFKISRTYKKDFESHYEHLRTFNLSVKKALSALPVNTSIPL